MSKPHVSTFTFGALTFTVKGLGVFVGGAKVRELAAGLTQEQLKKANTDAWSMRRKCGRSMDRYSNITVHGSSQYDAAAFSYFVCESVCKETWNLMRG